MNPIRRAAVGAGVAAILAHSVAARRAATVERHLRASKTQHYPETVVDVIEQDLRHATRLLGQQ
jgi:hypothetical protein